MKSYLLLVTWMITFSSLSWGSVKVEGEYSVDGETITLEQKFEQNKVYTFSSENYVLNIQFPKTETENIYEIEFQSFKKIGVGLQPRNAGKTRIAANEFAELKVVDSKKKTTSNMKVKISPL